MSKFHYAYYRQFGYSEAEAREMHADLQKIAAWAASNNSVIVQVSTKPSGKEESSQ